MKHHKDIINDLKLQNRIFKTILFFSLVGGVVYLTKPSVISPCPVQGCFVKTVYASEETSELNQVIDYIVKVFESEGKEVVGQALAISHCESKWNPQAYNFNTNGSSDYSVFQINTVHIKRYGTAFMTDWKENVHVAHALYKSQGWNPWVCSRVK